MGNSSSRIKKNQKAKLKKFYTEPAYWSTTFTTTYTIKPSQNCSTPGKMYADLTHDLIETFDHIHKKYPTFVPRIRFNRNEKSIEIGHAYRDFFNMLSGSKFYDEIPSLVTLSSYRTITYSDKDALLEVSSQKTNAFKELRSENGGFIAYDADHLNFEAEVKKAQKNSVPKKIIIGTLPQSRSELIHALINTAKGNNKPLRLVLGEQHLNLTARQMILEAMPYLGREKITLALEGFLYEAHQKILDEWLYAPQNAPLPFEFKYIQDIYKTLFVEAKKYGVRILSIDTEALQALPSERSSLQASPEGKYTPVLTVKRAEGMNYVSAKIIAYEVGKEGFVALVGSAHAADLTISEQNKIFGLGSLLEDTVSAIVLNVPTLEGRHISSHKVAVATIGNQDNPIKEKLEADIIVQEDNEDLFKSSPHELEDSRKNPAGTTLLDGCLEPPANHYNNLYVNPSQEQATLNVLLDSPAENPFLSHDILNGGITSHKTVAIGAGMALLGWLQTIDSLKKGDLRATFVSGGAAALGSTSIAAEVLLKNQNTLRQGTRILSQYATQVAQSASFLGEQAQTVTRTIPVILTDGTTALMKGATTLGRAMPFIGAVFSAYSVYQDGKNLYHDIETRDVKEGIKAALGIPLDAAIGITALIPSVGTPASLVLLAARLTSDCIIDQLWDPNAYKKSWAVLHDPSITTLDKVLSAIKTGIQFGWKLNPVVQGVCAWEEAHNLDVLHEKQNSERKLMQFTGTNGEDFVKILDSLEEKARVLDFTGGTLSSFGGYLYVDIYSPSKAHIHIGKDKTIFPQEIELGKTPVLELIIKMGQGVIYDYSFEEEVAKYYFIPIDRKEIATSAKIQEESLISVYWAPEDGTNVTFIAPSHPPIVHKNTVLPYARFEDYVFSYAIHGGTGINSYRLGQQSAKIFCGKGQNIIHIPFNEDHSRTFILEGFRDDGSCYLNLDDLTAENSLLQNATIGVRHSEGQSDLVLKFGNTRIELPKTHVKMFTVKTEDSIFYVDAHTLLSEESPRETSLIGGHIFKPFHEAVGLSIVDTSRDSRPSQIFSGTSGADLFTVDAKKSGNTEIKNFSHSKDKIEIKNFDENIIFFSTIEQKNSDVFIPFHNENSLTLRDVSLTNLTEDIFFFTS